MISEPHFFKKILGLQWHLLHPDIRWRFSVLPLFEQPIIYRGELQELRCSKLGKIMAMFARPFIQGALIPYSARNVPVDIEIYTKSGCAHLVKKRTYRLPCREPIQFLSHMEASNSGAVLEYVGSGISVKLRLDVKRVHLHFTSDGFFWGSRLFRMRIPDFLTPGVIEVKHINEAPNRFRIHIEAVHSVFGTMFVQSGVFNAI